MNASVVTHTRVMIDGAEFTAEPAHRVGYCLLNQEHAPIERTIEIADRGGWLQVDVDTEGRVVGIESLTGEVNTVALLRVLRYCKFAG